jgi:hypothetical protein
MEEEDDDHCAEKDDASDRGNKDNVAGNGAKKRE